MSPFAFVNLKAYFMWVEKGYPQFITQLCELDFQNPIYGMRDIVYAENTLEILFGRHDTIWFFISFLSRLSTSQTLTCCDKSKPQTNILSSETAAMSSKYLCSKIWSFDINYYQLLMFYATHFHGISNLFFTAFFLFIFPPCHKIHSS